MVSAAETSPASNLATMGGWSEVLQRLTSGRSLARHEAAAALRAVLAGEATPAQIAGFIVALRMKGETVEELSGLLDALVESGTVVPLDLDAPGRPPVIDIVGSGGDASHSVNVSTMAALVVAGAGGRVCKHGNRAASSKSGSADVLEALGVTIEVEPATVAHCVEVAGVGFCFAPRFNPAMRHAGPPRRELGIATAFNYLGPVTNPARVRRLVLGVGDPAMARPMIDVLAGRGAERVWVVHGRDGMDELTTTDRSDVLALADGEVAEVVVDPEALGLARVSRADLAIADATEGAAAVRRVLGGEAGPARDIVVLNAAAGLVVADLAADLAAGVALAAAAIDSGAAAVALDRLIEGSAG